MTHVTATKPLDTVVAGYEEALEVAKQYKAVKGTYVTQHLVAANYANAAAALYEVEALQTNVWANGGAQQKRDLLNAAAIWRKRATHADAAAKYAGMDN